MSYSLPAGINMNVVPNEAERSRLLAFYRRFVEQRYAEYGKGHWIFAAYAAVPVLLTPDLLYKLWTNFRQYYLGNQLVSIHRIAVADVLLCSLCRELGNELYEMQPDIRNALLSWLRAQTDPEADNPMELFHPEDIARFVVEYIGQLPRETEIWGKGYEEAHLWNAYSFFDLDKTQQLLLDKLKTTQESTEKIRVLEAVRKTGKQLNVLFSEEQLKNRIPDFQNVSTLAGAWSVLIQRNPEGFVKTIEQYPQLKDYLKLEKTEGAIEVSISVEKGQAERLEQVKTTIYALIVGVDQVANPSEFQQTNAEVATAMQHFIQEYAAQRGYDLRVNLLINAAATSTAVGEALDRLENASNGDLCFFYYAGGLLAHPVALDDPFFAFPETDFEKNEAVLSLSSVGNKLKALARAKPVHCLAVLDPIVVITDGITAPQATRPSLTDDSSGFKGSMVVLDSGFLSTSRTRGGYSESSSDCIFTTSLLEALQEGSTECSYRALFGKVKLKMMQRVERRQPVLQALPGFAADYRFLSDQFEKKEFYSVRFDPSLKEWILLAGSIQGVRPSLDFMHTYFRLKSGEKLSVKDVFEGYSNFFETVNADTNTVLEGYLVQNALPKIPMSFSPDHDEVLRKRFEEAVEKYNIYYIKLINDSIDAKYVIRSDKGPDGYLAFGLFRNTPGFAINNITAKPVFGYTADAFEFIKQLEYIAQWRGVLEYDKQAGLNKNSVKIVFEVIEGQPVTPESLNSLKGEVVEKTEVIQIRYIKSEHGDWLQPAIRCKVINQGDTVLYVGALFLSHEFGITKLEGGVIVPPKQDNRDAFSNASGETYIRFNADGQSFNAIPINVEEAVFERNANEINEYLKIFISDRPIELGPLLQENLEYGGDTRRSVEFMSRGNIDFSDTEWASIAYPLSIMKVEGTDIRDAHVEQDAQSGAITLQTLIQEQKSIPLRELDQPQYTLAWKELRTKLCALGLLDPVFAGDVQTTFRPLGEGTPNMDEAIVAQREFCRARDYAFEKEMLTPGLLRALLDAKAEGLFPMQLEENESDSDDTRLAKAVLRTMQKEGYWIARCPRMYNIVYVEGVNSDGSLNDNRMDEWNDLRLVIRITENGNPELLAKDACTTEPGLFFTQNPLNPGGAAHIAPGQYKSWIIGLHKGRLPALVQRDSLRVYRDVHKTGRRNAGDPVEVGAGFGLNQHGTGADTLSDRVGQHGAGALVGQDNSRHLAFMALVQKDVRAQANPNYFFIGAILEEGVIALPPRQRRESAHTNLAVFYPDKKIIQKMVTGNKINMTAIAWHELLVQASRAVGRIAIGSDIFGTGFLVEGGYLLTANHVLKDKEAAEKARLDMNYELGSDGAFKNRVEYQLDWANMITSPVDALNFTYIKVVDRADAPLAQWGYLKFENGELPGEHDSLVVIHHPEATDKKISFDPDGAVRVDSSNNTLYYNNDTKAGSGGAPVLNSLLQVVAIHVGKGRDGNINYGKTIGAIAAFIRQATNDKETLV